MWMVSLIVWRPRLSIPLQWYLVIIEQNQVDVYTLKFGYRINQIGVSSFL